MLHNTLATLFNSLLTSEEIPTWLLKGRTSLIEKKSMTTFDKTNYRPITCLSTIWKLFSALIANQIYKHLHTNNLIPSEQKGCIRKTLGTIDQLYIDKEILHHYKNHQLSLFQSWIDYQKAFDSVHHEWIFDCLKKYKINTKIINYFSLVHYNQFQI